MAQDKDSDITIPPLAVGKLRESLTVSRKLPLWNEMISRRDEVLARFSPIFQPANIPNLQADDFRPFLYVEQNHHWTGLHRQVNRLTADMDKLRRVLAILVDESRPIEDRLDEIDGQVLGMGNAIATAILTVAFPDKYGVWNATSEEGLTNLGTMPKFARGTSFGRKFRRINEVLTAARNAVGTDFWTLDALLWEVLGHTSLGASPAVEKTTERTEQLLPPAYSFGLEKHLQDFLFDNWDQTQLGREWALYTLPGEPDKGYEFVTGVGRIDLLARHRSVKKWLVIELKRSDITDVVVGQAARYMGRVRKELAEPGDEVFGLIIAQSVDKAMPYAVASVPNLSYQLYEVEFKLHSPTE